MISLQVLLGFLTPLPARSTHDKLQQKRRPVMMASELSPYMLRDIGLDDPQTIAEDARWLPAAGRDR